MLPLRTAASSTSPNIPEYVLGRWWEQLLHNQGALRLKARLLFQPGVMVTSVPWQLHSALPHVQRPPPRRAPNPRGPPLRTTSRERSGRPPEAPAPSN